MSDNFEIDKEALVDAVKAWIRAEFTFRHDVFAGSMEFQNHYCDAMERVREIATGKRDVVGARIVLKAEEEGRPYPTDWAQEERYIFRKVTAWMRKHDSTRKRKK
jgi:hypothetical protein